MPGENEWNEDLFGCCNDCGSCCYGFCCTPCLFGSNANKISGKNCFLMCCAYGLLANCYLCFIPHMMERQKMREKYNLKENPSCGDLLTTLCCGPCALCQEAREMKGRDAQPKVAFKAGEGPPVISQPM
ncbi:unnamed protein product [Adineta steineri]|uniref:Uncharacterized protein n=1 Tax=Adineta steineri TaxID=433720 RepID=A0A813MZS5_9BILA|nr:unnamed protein product [Adineta steineri]CAF0996890.1 unnamed protein product [Adineta steineri]